MVISFKKNEHAPPTCGHEYPHIYDRFAPKYLLSPPFPHHFPKNPDTLLIGVGALILLQLGSEH